MESASEMPDDFLSAETEEIRRLKEAIEFGAGHPEVIFDAFGAEQLKLLETAIQRSDPQTRLNLAVVRCWNKSAEELNVLFDQLGQLPLHGVFLVIQEARDIGHQTFHHTKRLMEQRMSEQIIVPMGVREAPLPSTEPDHIAHGWTHTSPLNAAFATATFTRSSAGHPLQPCTVLALSSTLEIDPKGITILQQELSKDRPPEFLSHRIVSDPTAAISEESHFDIRNLLRDALPGSSIINDARAQAEAIEWKQWDRNTLRAHDLDRVRATNGFPNLFDGRKRPAATLGRYLPPGASPNTLIGGHGAEDHASDLMNYRLSKEFRARIDRSVGKVVQYVDLSVKNRPDKASRAGDSAKPYPADAAMLKFTDKDGDEELAITHGAFQKICEEGRVPEAFSDFIFP